MSVPITALMLFLTLPVTVATAERSFSKLRFIKNFLRCTISELPECIGLAFLSIKAESAGEMNIDSPWLACLRRPKHSQSIPDNMNAMDPWTVIATVDRL